MNWSKFAYHSFLTILLGVTLSVCSNVMETDDFEIEAIANSSSVIHGSVTVTSGNNQITFSNSFSDIPTITVLEKTDNSTESTTQTTLNILDRITDVSKSGFTYNCCRNSATNSKIFYSSIGK